MSAWTWDSEWPAPAKINLFLHVVGRRHDGYHELQTAFRFLDIADRLRFSPRDDERIVRANDVPGVAAEDDLVVRAARALQQHAGAHQGVSIAVDKRLPMGGGLGGGSSDAATTLIAINHLWQLGLQRQELQQLGLRLGADVPVFIHGRSCFAEGIGERFSTIGLPPAWYLLVAPAVQVPTPEIFRAPELVRDTPKISAGDWRPGFGHNDLEPVAAAHYQKVAETLACLRQFGEARMSGSGACCFVEFATEAAARAACCALPDDYRAYVCAGIDRHPLHHCLTG